MTISHDGPAGVDDLYAGRPPWEIGCPQPAVAALADGGAFAGRFLDVGCGTGEHTLLAAALGLDATGIERSPLALEAAERKARERGLKARFLRQDALRLPELGEIFDTALDSLVLHALRSEDRAGYLDGLRAVLRPGGRVFVLCYSDQQAPDTVPHTMSQAELESCFADGWTLDSLEPSRSGSTVYPDGVAAWLASATRT
ncbi:MAG TPA: class I SAM-dependent methyltransferase [Actinocrinis sp.]|nr:class I SAM-dependent methyltransferase [Actinocrinis sp.]